METILHCLFSLGKTVKIPISCCVKNCSNSMKKNENVKFSLLPKDSVRRKLQLNANGRVYIDKDGNTTKCIDITTTSSTKIFRSATLYTAIATNRLTCDCLYITLITSPIVSINTVKKDSIFQQNSQDSNQPGISHLQAVCMDRSHLEIYMRYITQYLVSIASCTGEIFQINIQLSKTV